MPSPLVIAAFLLWVAKMQASLPEKYCLGTLATTTYRAVEGHALLGHTFMDVRGTSAVKCLAHCLSHHGRCRSFNYDHVNMVCQMNDATKEEFMDDFTSTPNYSFFGNNFKLALTSGKRCPQTAEPDVTSVAESACYSANDGPLGMTIGLILANKISASTWADGNTADDVRLNGGGWCARHSDTSPWVKVDLDAMVYVTGVQYTGGRLWDSSLDEFTVSYGDDGINWMTVQNGAQTENLVFGVPPNGTAVVTSRFPSAILTRFIRLKPPTWSAQVASNGNPFCLRFELLGCRV